MQDWQVYREILLDHRKNPRYNKIPERFTNIVVGNFQECMDHLQIAWLVQNSKINKIGFEGEGCSVSTASASLLVNFCIGKEIDELVNKLQNFISALMNQDQILELEKWGEIAALSAIRKESSRLLCAGFPWRTFIAGLKGEKTFFN